MRHDPVRRRFAGGTLTALLAFPVAFPVLIALCSCGGPERAPHQPITGVDRPADERAANPHDVEPPKDRESRTQD